MSQEINSRQLIVEAVSKKFVLADGKTVKSLEETLILDGVDHFSGRNLSGDKYVLSTFSGGREFVWNYRLILPRNKNGEGTFRINASNGTTPITPSVTDNVFSLLLFRYENGRVTALDKGDMIELISGDVKGVTPDEGTRIVCIALERLRKNFEDVGRAVDDIISYCEKEFGRLRSATNFLEESQRLDKIEGDFILKIRSLWGRLTVLEPIKEKVIYRVQKRVPRAIPTVFDKILSSDVFSLPTIEDDGFYVKEEIWHLTCRNFIRKKPTLFTGATGTGKTQMVNLLRKRIESVLHIHDMSAMVDAQSSLLGTHRLSGGRSWFDYAPFVSHIQSKSIILLDELSRAPKTAANILFPVLDDRRELYLDSIDGDRERVIKVHKDAMFFATANIGGEYSGTSNIDLALADRMFVIELDYMQPDVEQQVLMRRTRCTKEAASAIASIAEEIRELHKNESISGNISHRHTLETARMCRDGFNINFSCRSSMLQSIPKEERDTVLAVINRYASC